jgi:hypothetical protein
LKKKGISLGKGFSVGKDGSIKKVAYYTDASAAIRAKKSKKSRVVTGQKAMSLPPGPKR